MHLLKLKINAGGYHGGQGVDDIVSYHLLTLYT